MDPSKKWACDHCTFENWASATRCTMCRAARVIGQSIEGPPAPTSSSPSSSSSLAAARAQSPLTLTQSSALSSTSSPSSSSSTIICDTSSTSKWPCQVCTYLNWPRSGKCAQCDASRGARHRSAAALLSSSPPPAGSSAAELQHGFEHHLRISAANNTSNNERNKRMISPTATANEAQHHASLLGGSAASNGGSGSLAQANCKWTCQACTYENWPRSKCCILCGHGRGNTSPQQQQRRIVAQRDTPSPPHTGAAAASHAQEHRSLSPFTSLETGQDSGSSNNYDYERRVRTLRRRMRETDWSWLTACMGVVEGDMNPVEAYLSAGGDPTRKLTNPEVALLNNRTYIFEAGHTLVHLAIRFHREDLLGTLLSRLESGSSASSGLKCVPSYVAPDLASAICKLLTQSFRQRKGSFPCYYATDWPTYSLPPEIEDLPAATQEQLFSEFLDRDAQKELEEDCEIINWSEEVRRTSRLYALWNRSAGDCLLDSVLQATWGVFDKENALRRAMSDSLHEAGHIFFPRWKDWETRQALELDFSLHDSQLAADWAGLLSLASQPGASLEQVHVFVLAHVLRRPIIVYGVKYVKSWRGENLGLAKFEGVYLPLHWEPSFCSRSPIALGYTRGHFCALIAPEPTAPAAASSTTASGGGEAAKAAFLPLMTCEQKILPIHFLAASELGKEEIILKQWLDVGVTETGLWVAQQKTAKPPLLVAQMTEEWLNHYRKLAQSSTAPFNSRAPSHRSASSPAPNVNNGSSNSSHSLSHSLAHTIRGHSPSTAACVAGASALPCSAAPGPKSHEANIAVNNNNNNNNNNNQGYSSDGDSDEE